jgi:hypothetical protein
MGPLRLLSVDALYYIVQHTVGQLLTEFVKFLERASPGSLSHNLCSLILSCNFFIILLYLNPDACFATYMTTHKVDLA